jgi:hypothetical protein
MSIERFIEILRDHRPDSIPEQALDELIEISTFNYEDEIEG